jgi:RNA polymerase sigma-70 factor, ECF subfamily
MTTANPLRHRTHFRFRERSFLSGMRRGDSRVPHRATVVVVRVDSNERFEQIVLPEIEVLYRVSMSLTRNAADAEDLVQDTLVRAYRAIARFDGRHPRAWLLTILRNTHINRNRRRRPELLRSGDVAETRVTSFVADAADTVVDVGFDAEVERALRGLDQPFRQVVELIDIEGLSYAEAAKVLGVPAGTVMSRLHRARGRIRNRLDRSGVVPRSTA